MNVVLFSIFIIDDKTLSIFGKGSTIRHELKIDYIIIFFVYNISIGPKESLNNIFSSGVFISEWLMMMLRILDNKKNKKKISWNEG